MKKLVISAVTLAVFLSILITGFNVSYSTSKESTNIQEVTFKVDGMTCKMCPLTIKTALKKLDGVVNAEVSYEDKEAIVNYEQGKVTTSNMIKAMKNAGFIAVVVAKELQENASPNKNMNFINILVGNGPDALFLTPDEKYLYVANVEDSFVSVIDTNQNKVIKNIDVTGYPWGFTRIGKSKLVALSNWNKGIDIIDFTDHKVIKNKLYGYNLGGITSNTDGKYLYAVATEVNKVFKIDSNSLEILDEYATGNGPDGIGISKGDDKLYIANTKDGTIQIINLHDKSTKIINTGGKPELIHSNHDRSKLYISNFNNNLVHIIDTEKDVIIKDIKGLDGPEEAVLSKSGKVLYIVNFNSSKVLTFDANSYEKLKEEYPVGKKPIGIISAMNDTKLYVSNYGDNSLTVIEIKNKEN